MSRDQPRICCADLPVFTAVSAGFVWGLEGRTGVGSGHGGHGKPRSFQ
jgi:hypothetical protein